MKCILGVSGGMDSTLVNLLSSIAFGSSNLYTYSLPTIYNSEGTKKAAFTLPKLLNNHFEEIEIKVEEDDGENGQAWKRALILQKKRDELIKQFPASLVIILNTSNFSEIKLANFTINGDTIGDVSCLKKLYKSEIYQLIDWMLNDNGREYIKNNFPSLNNLNGVLDCVNSVSQIIPSAELKKEQSDSDVLLNGDYYYIVSDMILIAKEYSLRDEEIVRNLIGEENFLNWASIFYKNAESLDVAKYAIKKVEYRMNLTEYKANNI